MVDVFDFNLINYWGYLFIVFFVLYIGYVSMDDLVGVINEFWDMVKVLYCVGIEVILDVVFNYIGEGGVDGFIFFFKSIEN